MPTSLQPIRIQVANECGEAFRDALAARLAGTPLQVGPIDGSSADALVIGGRDVEQDLQQGLASGARWVQTLTAGVDRVLAFGLDRSRVVLTNGSAATARPVAEFAMARVLEHAKQLPVLAAQQRARTWAVRWLGSLAGATITVVGLGAIGSRVATVAKAFEMHVVGIRRDASRDHESCDEVLSPDRLGEALGRSEYCVLAPALTPETAGIVSEAVLDQARDGLLLVNVGRGELLDEQALMRAVRAGRVAAALDVFEHEPLPADSPLWDVDGIAVSPHTATLTPPLIDWLADLVADNARRFAAGRPLLHVIDDRLGYPARR